MLLVFSDLFKPLLFADVYMWLALPLCKQNYHWAYRPYLQATWTAGNDAETSSAQHHVPGSKTEAEVSELREVSGRQRNTDTKKLETEWTLVWPLELPTSGLWLTDRLRAEDGDAVTAPHQANWLAKTGSVFPTPTGTNGVLAAIPACEPLSGLEQKGIRKRVLVLVTCVSATCQPTV